MNHHRFTFHESFVFRETQMLKNEHNFFKIFEAYLLPSVLWNFTYTHFQIYIKLFSINFKNISSMRKTLLEIYEHLHKNMNTCIDYIKNYMWLITDNYIGFLTQIVWLKDTKGMIGIYSLRLCAVFHLSRCVVFMIYWQLLQMVLYFQLIPTLVKQCNLLLFSIFS